MNTRIAASCSCAAAVVLLLLLLLNCCGGGRVQQHVGGKGVKKYKRKRVRERR